jgi:hypothetical protein
MKDLWSRATSPGEDPCGGTFQAAFIRPIRGNTIQIRHKIGHRIRKLHREFELPTMILCFNQQRQIFD